MYCVTIGYFYMTVELIRFTFCDPFINFDFEFYLYLVWSCLVFFSLLLLMGFGAGFFVKTSRIIIVFRYGKYIQV